MWKKRNKNLDSIEMQLGGGREMQLKKIFLKEVKIYILVKLINNKIFMIEVLLLRENNFCFIYVFMIFKLNLSN